MNSKNETHIEPYRILFPIACLLGLIGVIFWIFFQMGWIHFYPRSLHGNLMFFGFLWAFVAGFLMTAVPKMTSTVPAHILEISVSIILVFIQLILNIRNLVEVSVVIFAVQNLFLLFFILRRFLVNRKIPFFGFIFLPVAFIQSFVGITLSYYGLYERNIVILLCGEAFILNLILGLGSRLIPVISRLPNSLLPNETTKKDSWLIPTLILMLINIGYWTEISGMADLGIFLRVVGILIAIVNMFRFFSKPTSWTYLGVGLKIAILMLPIGHILSLSFFKSPLAGSHLFYIGSFTLITFLIASRVMLAHGNQNLTYEVSSKRLLAVTLLFLLSAILRFFVGIDFASYLLSLSALLFMTSTILWSIKFFKILSSQLK